MKTDRFSDSIRRKLESIRPDFTEKDWTRMQSALHQATPPHPGPSATGGGSIWTGQPWLLAAATVSTIALVAVSVWQWREISTLRQTVEQLNHSSKTAQITPVLPQPEYGAEQPAVRQRDTVYITQRVPIPQQPPVENGNDRSVRRADLPPEQQYAVAPEKPVSANDPRPNNEQNSNINPITHGDSSTSIEKNDASLPSKTLNEAVREQTKNRQFLSPGKRSTDLNPSSSASDSDLAKTQLNRQRSTDTYKPVTKTSAPGSAKSAASTNTQTEPASDQDALAAEETKAPGTVEELASLPLSVETRNWQTALTRRARKIRVEQPAVAVAQPTAIAPASQPARVATRFRVGTGGELSGGIWSAGLFTELLAGQHFMLSVGLSKATHSSSFINDFDFESRTNRDFRREFTRGLDPKLDPKRDILNIETRVTRLQLPVNIGYRIPLSQSVTFTPAVGTILNLSSTEYVTFYLPINGPQRGFDKGTLSMNRSVDLISSFQLIPGIEWQRGHWVLQGGPVFRLPTQSDPKSAQAIPGWPQTAVGLRARLLYQF